MNDMNTQMLSRNALMRKIMEYSFYIYDLNLYLDTHPNDRRTLSDYQQMREQYDKLVDKYMNNFGPINAQQVTSDNYWSWIEGPWPWEGGME